jgi:uncharacterized protein YjbI with pentapeptide repeats
MKALSRLKVFEYGENVPYVPQDIGDFKNLTHLDLSKSEFHYIGMNFTGICNFLNLKVLSLENIKTPANMTPGATLPDCLGDLTKLERVEMSGSTFGGTLPLSFSKLKHLTEFDLDAARFTECNPIQSTRVNNINGTCNMGLSHFYCYCDQRHLCRTGSCIDYCPSGATCIPGGGLVYATNVTVDPGQFIVLPSSVQLALTSLHISDQSEFSVIGNLTLNNSSLDILGSGLIIVDGSLALSGANVSLAEGASLQVGGCIESGSESDLILTSLSNANLTNGTNRISTNISYLGENCTLPSFRHIDLLGVPNICEINNPYSELSSYGTLSFIFNARLSDPSNPCNASAPSTSHDGTDSQKSPIPGLDHFGFLIVVILVPVVSVLIIILIVVLIVAPIRRRVFPFRNRQRFGTTTSTTV